MNEPDAPLLLILLIFGPLFLLSFFFICRGEMKFRKRLKQEALEKSWADKWMDPKSGWAHEILYDTPEGNTAKSYSARLISVEPKIHKWFFSSIDQYERPLDGGNKFHIGPNSTLALADHIIKKAKKAMAPTRRIKELARTIPYASYYSDRRGW